MTSLPRQLIAFTLAVGLLAGAAPSVMAQAKPARVKTTAPNYKLSGPYSHDNLTIFFLHGPDQLKDKKILTLEEALKDKKVTVHETRDVSKLAIENSSQVDVFVQAGDIVTGGRQDRVLTVDMLVPPRSGKLPLPSLCVEQGRWSQRDKEDVYAFNSASETIFGSRLKVAARFARSHGQLWRGVGTAQTQLGNYLDTDVKDSRSTTSLPLSMANAKLQVAVDAYVKELSKHLDKKKDVIGYAVAINGKMSHADVYVTAELFGKLWPKLLRGSVIEAIAEKAPNKKAYGTVKAETVQAFLEDAEKGKMGQKEILRDLLERYQETTKNLLIETYNEKTKTLLRRSYMAK